MRGPTGATSPSRLQRCPVCRAKIVIPLDEELVVKNAILRVNVRTGQASAKCPRCKHWMEVPLRYSES